jgi:hypothetical protein
MRRRVMATESPVSPTPTELTGARTSPDVVEVPSRTCLALAGEKGPETEEFSSSVGALYGIAYGLKFAQKKTKGKDFKVGALVGIWWAEGHDLTTGRVPPRDTWRWTVQLDVPSVVSSEEVGAVVNTAVAKRGGKLEGSAYAKRVELAHEPARRFGRILHVGPFSEEPRSLDAMETMLDSKGLQREMWHVEVYLSDPQRTAPEKLRTVLLVPIAR